ncbi:hypothetical protein J6590_005771 [Homalodisca vitripennis]|nr:hypothetical protein J6590_005771 [Homalodisca vitripennis]
MTTRSQQTITPPNNQTREQIYVHCLEARRGACDEIWPYIGTGARAKSSLSQLCPHRPSGCLFAGYFGGASAELIAPFWSVTLVTPDPNVAVNKFDLNEIGLLN